MEGSRLRDQRPDQGAGAVAVALDDDAVARAQVEGQREVRDVRVAGEQPPQRVGGRRVGLVVSGRRRRLGGYGGRAVADAEAHHEVVGVVGVPGLGSAPGDEVGQGRRRRVVTAQQLPLVGCGRPDPVADVGEVAQVAAAGDGTPGGAAGPLPVELHQHEAQRPEQEGARGEQAAVAGRARLGRHGRHQRDRTQAPEHRHRAGEHAGRALVGLEGWRRVDGDPGVGRGHRASSASWRSWRETEARSVRRRPGPPGGALWKTREPVPAGSRGG